MCLDSCCHDPFYVDVVECSMLSCISVCVADFFHARIWQVCEERLSVQIYVLCWLGVIVMMQFMCAILLLGVCGWFL